MLECHLVKLELYEIKGCNLRWFKSYLSNGKQFATYGDRQINTKIICGVPAGSIFGPLLFKPNKDCQQCKPFLFSQKIT